MEITKPNKIWESIPQNEGTYYFRVHHTKLDPPKGNRTFDVARIFVSEKLFVSTTKDARQAAALFSGSIIQGSLKINGQYKNLDSWREIEATEYPDPPQPKKDLPTINQELSAINQALIDNQKVQIELLTQMVDLLDKHLNKSV